MTTSDFPCGLWVATPFGLLGCERPYAHLGPCSVSDEQVRSRLPHMGDYRIVIEAVGGHGCTDSRPVQAGEPLAPPCSDPNCPDCALRAFVRTLAATGNSVKLARLEHWPAHLDHRSSTYPPAGEVVDDILKGERASGSFTRR